MSKSGRVPDEIAVKIDRLAREKVQEIIAKVQEWQGDQQDVIMTVQMINAMTAFTVNSDPQRDPEVMKHLVSEIPGMLYFLRSQARSKVN